MGGVRVSGSTSHVAATNTTLALFRPGRSTFHARGGCCHIIDKLAMAGGFG